MWRCLISTRVDDRRHGGGHAGQTPIGRLRDPFVHEARRHVFGDDLCTGDVGDEGTTDRATAFAALRQYPPCRTGARREVAGGGRHIQDGVEGIGYPEPLEHPRGEERGDTGVLMRRATRRSRTRCSVARSMSRSARTSRTDSVSSGSLASDPRSSVPRLVAAVCRTGELTHVESRCLGRRGLLSRCSSSYTGSSWAEAGETLQKPRSMREAVGGRHVRPGNRRMCDM